MGQEVVTHLEAPQTGSRYTKGISCDYLYSPSIGAVTKNSCKNFGKYRYCWVSGMLDNLVPVSSHRCQVKRFLLQ